MITAKERCRCTILVAYLHHSNGCCGNGNPTEGDGFPSISRFSDHFLFVLGSRGLVPGYGLAEAATGNVLQPPLHSLAQGAEQSREG